MARRLPEFPLVAAQASSYPLVELLKHRGGMGAPEVGHPTVGVAPQFAEHALKADASIALGDTSHRLCETLLALGRDREADLSLALSERVAQELTPKRTIHRALLAVDLQLQPHFQEACHGGHRPLPRSLAPDVDVAVVGVPTETVASALQLLVQIVQ